MLCLILKNNVGPVLFGPVLSGPILSGPVFSGPASYVRFRLYTKMLHLVERALCKIMEE